MVSHEGLRSASSKGNTISASYGGAIFSGAHQFTVAGGNFTTITKSYSTAPTMPLDFPKIPMGNIDLRREIWLNDESGVVGSRRLHSARIEHGRSSVWRTVAVYQGNDAEREWRRDIAKYVAVRHPNIIQLYGTASAGNTYAAVFHDDLIPFLQILDFYRHSHFSTAYIYAYIGLEFRAADRYFQTIFKDLLHDLDCTFFIRRSTGRFCVDLVPGGVMLHPYPTSDKMSTQRGLKFLAGKNRDTVIIDSLTLGAYHQICSREFSLPRVISISTSVAVNLGSVVNCPPQNSRDGVVEIAHLQPLNPQRSSYDWSIPGKIMENGWKRVDSVDVMNTAVSVGFWSLDKNFWLAQANHIFTKLQLSTNFRDYVVLTDIYFIITTSVTKTAYTPTGFLFLCPSKHFQTGKSSFKWPECPAYWSLDPSGAEPLTTREVTSLGFPSLRFTTEVEGYSWDTDVYAGLRQFHQAKGFDPNSQDVARHLCHDLYQLSIQRHMRCAHIDDKDSENTSDGDDISQDQTSGSEKLENAFESTPTDPTDNDDTSGYPTEAEYADVPESTLDTFLVSASPDVAEIPASRTFKLVMNVQLTLILLLAVVWIL
ncbi:hypothetical protein MSAN_00295000 [Mycena sanguinolenta]|uniref:Protein kinase domain-containing protein n=1 Tax=Mycena sanguinolenta TaxID=230812 RepID=A0A8H6ZD83_9AGAR|nr:hypothetical protein MSAN_00295000 [Mycena sanguinolenta]